MSLQGWGDEGRRRGDERRRRGGYSALLDIWYFVETNWSLVNQIAI